jgi:hypothetical protein
MFNLLPHIELLKYMTQQESPFLFSYLETSQTYEEVYCAWNMFHFLFQLLFGKLFTLTDISKTIYNIAQIFTETQVFPEVSVTVVSLKPKLECVYKFWHNSPITNFMKCVLRFPSWHLQIDRQTGIGTFLQFFTVNTSEKDLWGFQTNCWQQMAPIWT